MQRRLRVCYFGTYLSAYPRNKIIIDGLRQQGVEVIECHVDLWKGIEPRWSEIRSIKGKVKIAWKMASAYLRLVLMHQDIADYDVMIVGYTGHFDVFVARLLSWIRRRPLVFDAFVSLYDTLVQDRRLFKAGAFPARVLLWIDRTTCNLSDAVLLDTDAHIHYFKDTLKICKTSFHRVWVGADDTVFYPRGAPDHDATFNVLFVGGFIPLQGVRYIVEAARMLGKETNIRFRVIGTGQEHEEIVSMARAHNMKNIEFAGWLPYEKLPDEIAAAHVCLGIFGTTDKAKRVIPNKVFMAVAMARPVITGDSTAIREAFTDRENILLCKMGDPRSIRDAVKLLKKNARLRARIAGGGYDLFRREFAASMIASKVKDIALQLRCDG